MRYMRYAHYMRYMITRVSCVTCVVCTLMYVICVTCVTCITRVTCVTFVTALAFHIRRDATGRRRVGPVLREVVHSQEARLLLVRATFALLPARLTLGRLVAVGRRHRL